jgi:transposase
MELEQRRIIKFWHLKGLKLQEIATELFSAYIHMARMRARPSIKYWLHQIKLERTDLQTQHIGGRPPLNDADAETLSLLQTLPSSSV